MIKSISIENYKSIQKLDIELGRVTVLIGANGSGKSNILEAIALSSAADNYKLDNEFLDTRGIRVANDPRFMRSAFNKSNVSKPIKVNILGGNGGKFEYILQKDNSKPYSSWIDKGGELAQVAKQIRPYLKKNKNAKEIKDKNVIDKIVYEVSRKLLRDSTESIHLNNFLIYSPELSALRSFEQEGKIEPLGVKGEGLYKLLKVLCQSNNQESLNELKSNLQLVDWFSDFDVSQDLSPDERRLHIRDKYLDTSLATFDQKSANEGFLFLLFYFCLFISKDTPYFFAVDNIDASLNPKLCIQLMIELNELAKKHKKQAIFTTHNPAILDGLNLDDDEQKLYVVGRNKLGHTTVKQVPKPKLKEGQKPVRLSEAFLKGYFGGLPKNF